MGRFAAKYTDEQRAAIVTACVDDGMSAPKAVRAAAAGSLSGLPPFEMPVGSARFYAGQERRKRTGRNAELAKQGDPLDQIDHGLKRALLIAAHALDQVEEKTRKRKYELTAADLEKARKATALLRETRALALGQTPQRGGQRKPDPRATAESEKTPDVEETGGLTLADKLIEDHRANATGHTTDGEPEPTETGRRARDTERDTDSNATHGQTTDEAAGSGVLA